jgi:ribonuclease D
MTSEKFADVELITLGRDLAGLAEVLSGEARVAVDTESDSLYSYREKVCLIQFSTSQADYLVDRWRW